MLTVPRAQSQLQTIRKSVLNYESFPDIVELIAISAPRPAALRNWRRTSKALKKAIDKHFQSLYPLSEHPRKSLNYHRRSIFYWRGLWGSKVQPLELYTPGGGDKPRTYKIFTAPRVDIRRINAAVPRDHPYLVFPRIVDYITIDYEMFLRPSPLSHLVHMVAAAETRGDVWRLVGLEDWSEHVTVRGGPEGRLYTYGEADGRPLVDFAGIFMSSIYAARSKLEEAAENGEQPGKKYSTGLRLCAMDRGLYDDMGEDVVRDLNAKGWGAC